MPEKQFNNSDVQFQEESRMLYGRFQPSSKKPVIVDFILRLRIVQNETQANYVLVGFILIALAATIYLFSSMGSGSLPSKSEMERVPLPGSAVSQ